MSEEKKEIMKKIVKICEAEQSEEYIKAKKLIAMVQDERDKVSAYCKKTDTKTIKFRSRGNKYELNVNIRKQRRVVVPDELKEQYTKMTEMWYIFYNKNKEEVEEETLE